MENQPLEIIIRATVNEKISQSLLAARFAVHESLTGNPSSRVSFQGTIQVLIFIQIVRKLKEELAWASIS